LARWAAPPPDPEPELPWLDIGPCDPLSDHPGEHHVSFVSRHHIAESGLRCPKCGDEAAMRADYSGLRRTRLGEAVRCECCHEILVASPDTEHGDHDLPYDAEVFHRFVRIDPAQALREQWGGDISGSPDQMTTEGAPRRTFPQEEDHGDIHLQREKAPGES
jgi:hypothetical protein